MKLDEQKPISPETLQTLCGQIRKKTGWTQAQLATELGCDEDTIRRWERGVVPIPVYRRQLDRVARANGVSTSSSGARPFTVGSQVRRKRGDKNETGEVVRVSPSVPRVRVRWASGKERGYEESYLSAAP